jgi:hypothetical protein
MKAESYPLVISVILLVVGQSSMIQGIVSISTSFLSGLPWVQFFGVGSGVVAMGVFFIFLGISAQIVGFITIFFMRGRRSKYGIAERVPQKA